MARVRRNKTNNKYFMDIHGHKKVMENRRRTARRAAADPTG